MRRLLTTRFVSPLIALVVFGSGLTGCRERAAPVRERPEDAPQRRLVDVHWQKQLEIGRSEEDTTLISPHRLVVSEAGLYVIDYIPKRILYFDHEGNSVWSYGRPGAGPDELRHPVDLKVDLEGNAWVLDQQNARITILDRNGNAVRRVSLTALPTPAHELIPLTNTEALLLVDRPKTPLVHIDRSGSVINQYPFPWVGYSRMDYLSTQLVTALSPTSSTWVAGFRMGDGFFVFSGEQWAGIEGWYTEAVGFPEVVTTRNGNTTSKRHASRPTSAARSIALSPERMYVLFGGETEHQNQIVDSFSLADGAYVESYLLPEAVRGIAWHDGGLYTVRHDPFPQIGFWRSAETHLR
jgi:hypothetical protein